MLTTTDVDALLDETEEAIASCLRTALDRPWLAKTAELWVASFRERKNSLTRLRRRVMTRTFNPDAREEVSVG